MLFTLPFTPVLQLLRFKSRGGILGTLAGGIAAGLGQQDNDESSDEEVEREWLVSDLALMHQRSLVLPG